MQELSKIWVILGSKNIHIITRCLALVPNVSTLVCTPLSLYTPLNGYLIKGFAIFLKTIFFGTPCMRILIQKGFNSATTECPKIKLAFWKYLNIALHGFLMGIFNPKLFSPDSSGPHKLKQLLRYGGNKDNKPKWRLLNISAPGWPIWTRTSPMGSILDILYRPKLHQGGLFWTYFTLSCWMRLCGLQRGLLGQSSTTYQCTYRNAHPLWKNNLSVTKV